MSAAKPETDASSEQSPTEQPPPRPSRGKLRVPIAVVTLYWLASFAFGWLDVSMFPRFLARAGVLLLALLILTVWWLWRGPFLLRYRFMALGWVMLCGVIATLLLHGSVLPPSVYMLAIPSLITIWTIWLVASRTASQRTQWAGLLVTAAFVWMPCTFVRMEGLQGNGAADFHWRWEPSAEAQWLQPDGVDVANAGRSAPSSKPLVATAEDWVGFRGEQRDATVSGIQIATDWDLQPPRLAWRTHVGPAWSSIVVVGERLFTQEQRGEREVVSCFDANSGSQIWIHEDQGRYEENLGGVGPRATPTFAAGRIFAQGAAGRLNCLDAVTGQPVSSRDIVADASARVPTWGFSGSPLVVADRVIVFAGGEKKHALLGYEATSGEIAWLVDAGTESYSSPHLLTLAGQSQVLFLGNQRLGAFDPESGRLLWSYQPPLSFGRPVLQPRLVGDADLLVSFAPDAGLTRIAVEHAVEHAVESWKVTEVWTTRGLKPDYSDLVHHGGYLYGFDGNIFCCLDLATGKRQWKGGRYGSGQMLLLADQPLLLVITEQGELVLVSLNPDKHEELARFPAIHGKTWNHPVISRGRLYVRNAEELACFELPLAAE